MISLRCPHCNVGLKVQEDKIPAGRESFNCPRCKQLIPVSVLKKDTEQDLLSSAETIVLRPARSSSGKLTAVANSYTNEQIFTLAEGIYIVGRKSSAPGGASIQIETTDRSMSRSHIRIEVKKDAKDSYKHYLSDNNSKNHTLYNGNYLQEGEVVILQNNDEIVIGHTILRFNE